MKTSKTFPKSNSQSNSGGATDSGGTGLNNLSSASSIAISLDRRQRATWLDVVLLGGAPTA